MNKQPAHQSSVARQQTFKEVLFGKVADYKALVKFRLTATVVFSAVMAYVIAAGGAAINWYDVLLLTAGGFLITGAANALNQALEKDFDKLMERTKNRPIAAGRMSPSEGILVAGICCVLGTFAFATFNLWTGFLGMLAMISYAFIYTPMKRVSPAAIFVGAIPGALPMLIGCVALQGEITALGIALFGVQFFWQFPHFLAIGWLGYGDYEKAGYRLVASQNGAPHPQTGLQSAILALFLLPFGYYFLTTGWLSIIGFVVFTLLTIGYSLLGVQLWKNEGRKTALQLMFGSLIYLPVVLLLLFIETML